MPTCLRCDHDGFTPVRLLSGDDDDTVRPEVQCTKCSLLGVLVCTPTEYENADDAVGEWE